MQNGIPERLMYNSSFWIEAWGVARAHSLKGRRQKNAGGINYWNKLAPQIDAWSEEQRSENRVLRVRQWLEQHKVLAPGSRMLDIGAGSGLFAIPFSESGAQVTALEPALELSNLMCKKAEDKGIRELDVFTQKWEDISLELAGWSGNFDLVFASLSPGVQDEKTLEKMITASRKWCFLCEFAGRRWNPVREKLWQEIFIEPMPLPEYNIFYPLNYLYSRGFFPSLELWTETWEEEAVPEEAVQRLLDYFSLYTEETPSLKRTVSSYVEKHQQEGIFRESFKVLLGMILWDVSDSWQ